MKTSASSLERLESRIAPANIVCAVIGHTLHITGDSAANSITVDGNADPTIFFVTALGDTVNGGPGGTGFTTPAGITNIVVKLLGGDDLITFSNAIAAIHLQGGLSIDGGNGANRVNAVDLTVDKNIAIRNGDSGPGTNTTDLDNLNVGGSFTLRNHAGETDTSITRNTTGVSTIKGNLVILNGTGADSNDIEDLNVGGNVTIKNGHGDGTTAGFNEIFNNENTSARSVIRGNVSISNLDGDSDSYDGIWDYQILGNLSINHGSGNFVTHFDGYMTSLPVIVRGNLTMKGTGATTIDVGTQYQHTGMIVGKAVTIISGDGGDSIAFNNLQVGGATKLIYGKDANTTQIDDSIFTGTFNLIGGAGVDTINIETTAAFALPTNFEKAATLSTGDGADAANFGGLGSGEFIYAFGTVVAHVGAGTNVTTVFNTHVIFPFGGSVQTVT